MPMSSIILLHYLAMGDSLVCHGLIREHCKNYGRVEIFAHKKYYTSVSFMFRDLPNLKIIKGDEAFAKMFIFLNTFRFGETKYDEVKLVGFPHLDPNSGEQFERQFYRLAGVDFAKKWDNFHVERDRNREEDLFRRIDPTGDYIFLHDDPRFRIDRGRVALLPVVSPAQGLTNNIFDWCLLIERAREVHVIDSSFMFLIDLLPYVNKSQELFIHRYARRNEEWMLPVLRKNWQIIQ